MRVCLILATAIIAVYGRPQNPADATITKYDFNNVGAGYAYSWESSDGTKRDETAEVLNEGQENESIAVRGSFSYLGPDGIVYTVSYVADENGYQPEGDHLPQAETGAVIGGGVLSSPLPPTFEIRSSALASLAGGGLG